MTLNCFSFPFWGMPLVIAGIDLFKFYSKNAYQMAAKAITCKVEEEDSKGNSTVF
jgi:hypothetical protein